MELFMKVTYSHVAGVDVHKDLIVITTICENTGSTDPVSQHFQIRSYTNDLIKMGQLFLDMGIRHVAMESTGIYWKPLYHVWNPMGIQVTLANAQHIKNVPGRKTDIKDSQWIAQLHRMGLIKPSFLPDQEFDQLRTLNRHRQNLIEDASRIKNRIQKILEDGNIKLGSVLSNVFGVAGLAVVRAIAEGTRSAAELTDLIRTNIKKDKKEVQEALTNTLKKYHCTIIKQMLSEYDHINRLISELDDGIGSLLEKYQSELSRLDEIPGIDDRLAQGILIEATKNMSAFKDDRTFAAWAGVAAGNNESAGKKKNQNVEKVIQF